MLSRAKRLRGSAGSHLADPWNPYGALWGPLGGSWKPRGSLWEASWKLLEASWSLLGLILETWKTPRHSIWVILGAAGRILGSLGVLLGALGRVLGALGRVLVGCWDDLGSLLEAFGRCFGAWEASLERFAEILKNLQKRCKVLQKSWFLAC